MPSAAAGPVPSRQAAYNPVASSDASVTQPGTVRRAGNKDEERKARREQLRSFYGIAPPGAPAIEANEGNKKEILFADGYGLDRGDESGDNKRKSVEAFDPAAYYDRLISESNLDDLMKKATVIATEMAQLESARHSLVYNHHHQLFSAGDTIQVLNSRTPQLLSIMTSLQDSFSSISQLTDSITTSDQPPPKLLTFNYSTRLQIMLDAEGKVESWWNGVRDGLTQQAADGNEQATKELEACRALMARIP